MAGEHRLRLLSAGAVKGGVAQLAAEFERATGQGIAVDFAPAPELRDRIAGGEVADVVILPQSMLDAAAAQGKLVADSRALLGRSRMGVAVHAQAPQSALADTEDFRRLVLGASAVVHNTASSGIYAAQLLDRLGLTATLASRVIVVSSGAGVMEYVAAHPPAAVGLAQISEVMVLIAKGCAVRLAGPLPDEIQSSTTYFAAVTAQGSQRESAAALIRHLTTPAARTAFAATGID